VLQLSTATLRDVDSAMEENFVAHVSWLPSQLPGARVVRSPELVLVDSGFESDTFNVICRARFVVDAAHGIKNALECFRDRRPFSWWVGPLDEPAQLGAALQRAGLVEAGSELGMIGDLSHVSSGAGPDELQIRRVMTPPDVANYAAVVAANWDPIDEVVLRYYATAADAIVAGESPLRLYVGYVDGRAVAAGEVCMAGGVAGLYGVATLANWRRRGYGLAVTAHALNLAAREGAHVGVLQASNDGRPVYARLGFRPHGQYSEYQRPPT